MSEIAAIAREQREELRSGGDEAERDRAEPSDELQSTLGNAALAQAHEEQRPPDAPSPFMPEPEPTPSEPIAPPPAFVAPARSPEATTPEPRQAEPARAPPTTEAAPATVEPARVESATPAPPKPGSSSVEPASPEPETALGRAAAEPAPEESATAPAAAPAAEGPAEAAVPPALPADAGPGDVLASLESAPPSTIVAAYEQAAAASAPALDRQREDVQATLPEIPAPTGLPSEGAAPPAKAEPGSAPAAGVEPPAAGPSAPAPDLAKTPEAPPVAQAPTVLAGGATSEQKPTDEALSRSAQAALEGVDIPAEEVPVSLGERPVVDATGDADPGRFDATERAAATEVGDEKARQAMLAGQDFGENAIFPVPRSEILASDRKLSAPGAPAADAIDPLVLEPEVAAGLDGSIGPVLAGRVGEQTAEYRTGEQRFHDDTAAAHGKARDDIAGLEQGTSAEQVVAQERARSEVSAQRTQWRKELDDAESDFSGKVSTEKTSHVTKVGAVRRKGEDDAARHYADAEAKAVAERGKARAEADRKKREAKKESSGFWGWAKRAAGALIDALKDAVNFVYDKLRKAVKWAFEQAKRLALAAIELARKAIVGLIKALGEVLKGLVTIALGAFPKIAAKINAAIDGAVDSAVSAVNKAADMLGKAVSAVLDFLAETLDKVLGLIQSIYNGVLTVIRMIVTGEFKELMLRIANLVAAAKLVPDTFESAALEELLGGDLDKPLSPAELAAAGETPKGVDSAPAPASDASSMPKEPWGEHNVGVDQVASGFELSPRLAAELQEAAARAGGVHEFAETSDPTRTMQSVVSEATGQTEDVASEKLPPDGLSPRERAAIRWKLMKDGISKWWSENWLTVLAGATAAILGFIALNIVTGGAILAALPPLMAVIGPLFVGLTIVTIAGHVKDYLEKAWAGDRRGGGKSLSRALASGAVELASYLTFKVGGAALKGAKAVAKGGVKLAQGAVKLATRGGKWILARGKILFKGLTDSGLGKRLTRLKELGDSLLDRLRFRKFRVLLHGSRFSLQGFINPWVTIADGKITEVAEGTKDAKLISEADLADVRKADGKLNGAKLAPGDVGSYRGLKKIGRKGDQLTPDHIPSRAAIVARKTEELKAAGQWPANPRERAKLLRQINEDAVTIGTETKIHTAGRTFGGKNKAAQIAADAKDLGAAARQDFEAVLDALESRGELTTDRVVGYLKAYNMNVAKGVFAYSKETDEMFLRFLELAAK